MNKEKDTVSDSVNINNLSDINKKEYRKLFVWTYRKIPFIKVLMIIMYIWALFSLYRNIIADSTDIYYSALITGFLTAWIFELLLLSILIFYVLPNVIFFINNRRFKRKYPDDYSMQIDEDGITFVVNNEKKEFLWRDYTVLECKYGIALINKFNPVAFIINTHNEEEKFEKVKLWAREYIKNK